MGANNGAVATTRRGVVIGGGLAGLSAALALLDAGFKVTLVERRPFLGGRAYSFVDQETGQEVDNGQHVFLGCCTAYRALVQRLGVADRTTLQRGLRVLVVEKDGDRALLSSTRWLPAPLHLLPSLLGYRLLSLGERLTTLRVLVALRGVDRERHREALDTRSFRDWLLDRGEHEEAIRKFWNLVTLPALNDDIAAVSAYAGIMVFQESFFRGRHGGAIGYSKVGLTELIGEAGRVAIERGGGALVLGQGVTRLVVEDGRVAAAELTSGQPLPGEVFVSATPWNVVGRLLPEPWSTHPYFRSLDGLQAAPIVGIHIWYDRPVMDGEFLAFLGSPVQWVFNKSAIMGLPGPGQYVCISVSGAWEHAPMSKEALRALFVPEVARLLPRAREATVERFIVVKQMGATFRSKPGALALRPGQGTPLPNLFLAGDWTWTGWPSTMES
ncbi:MAG: FAD-dependent oxidoreductase, partial [SAR202 cluster bacterium]|nr:FAD-dependent oxidoreductase [SAR202 cluster bacterium]